MKKILFVCTGNTCRSPMAEALLRQIATEEKLHIETQSAGIAAYDGMDVSRHALSALQEKNISYTGKSQLIDTRLIDWADYIITMTLSHKQMLAQYAPEKWEQIVTLKEIAGNDGEIEQEIRKLDKLYVRMEELRSALQAEFKIETGGKWSKEAEQRWEHELAPLLEEEQNLRKKLDQYNLNADIQDPFGGSLEEYRACRDEIETEIRKWICQLKEKES